MKQHILLEIQDQLQRGIEVHDSSGRTISVVYLFGSCLSGLERRESDLDLAFLLDQTAYKEDPFVAAAPAYHVATDLGMVLERETDVTILNASSLEIAYEIITSGKCLFETQDDRRLQYEIALRGMYFDFKPFLDDLRSKCLQNL